MARVIDAVIRLRDQFSGVLKNVNGNLSQFQRQMNYVSRNIGSAGKGISKVGKSLTTDITLPIIGIGTAAAKMAMDFQDGMAKISTVADTTKAPIDKLGSQIIQLSNVTGQAASDIQEGLYDAISAGVDTAKAMDFMTVAVKAAKGGFTDTKTSVDGLTTTLNAYGLATDKAASIANQMMVAQNLGKTTFGEMAASIGNVVPTAASLGVKTNELFSSLASLTANGIKTSEAVTGLKAAFSNVVKPSDQAAKMAQQLGLNFSAAHLQSVGWGKFLEEVKQKTGGNTEKMAQLFGSVEALNSVLTLTSDNGMGIFNESLKQMRSGTNFVDDAFNKVTNTSGAKFRESINKLKNAGIQLGNSLSPVISKLSDYISKVAGALSKLTPQQTETIVKFAMIAAAAGPVVWAFGGIMTTVSSTIATFNKVSKAVSAAGGIIGFLGSPAGWVMIAIAAIVALIAVGVLLYQNWDRIKQTASDIWVSIKNTFISGVNYVIDLLNKLRGVIGMPMIARVGLDVSHNTTANGMRAGRNALGTNYWGGGETWVGEHGPEKITLPKGTKIQDHQSSIKSGAKITIGKIADTVIIREESDIDKLADALVRRLDEVAPNMA